MKTMRNLNKQRGATMISILLWTAGAVLVLAASIKRWTEYQVESSGSELMEFVVKVKPKVTANYPAGIPDMTTQAMIDLDFARDDEVDVAGVTKIIVSDNVEATLAPNAGNTASVLTLSPVRESVCVNAVTKLWSLAYPLSINGVQVKTAVDDTVMGQAAAIATNCSNAANSIDLELDSYI